MKTLVFCNDHLLLNQCVHKLVFFFFCKFCKYLEIRRFAHFLSTFFGTLFSCCLKRPSLICLFYFTLSLSLSLSLSVFLSFFLSFSLSLSLSFPSFSLSLLSVSISLSLFFSSLSLSLSVCLFLFQSFQLYVNRKCKAPNRTTETTMFKAFGS